MNISSLSQEYEEGKIVIKHNETGNALFLILIAVALFAALSYAVTQSGRGGGNIDRETANLSSAQLVQFGSLMANTVRRLEILGGCNETELSFERAPFNGTDTDYVNITPSPADLSCHIYHPNGGNLTEFNPSSAPGLTTGSPEIEIQSLVQITGAGTTNFPSGADSQTIDITMFLRNMTEVACTAINRNIGLNLIPTDASDLNFRPFTGSFNAVSGNRDHIDGCFDITGGLCASIDQVPWGTSQNACFREQDTGDLIYFHILKAR